MTARVAWLPTACLGLLLSGWSGPAWPASEPAETARLEGDQTLEDLAKQLYDDPAASDEIRAVNSLPAGAQPPPGQPFALPGKQRTPAVNALGVASQAVEEARLYNGAEYAGQRFGQAETSLAQARQACRSADYLRCQKLADETWALARLARKEGQARRSAKNRFAVSVDSAGATRVEVMDGDGVEVAAQKKRTRIGRGQAVQVQPGKTPGPVVQLLEPPEPVLPFPDSRLVTASIHFHWKPVAGAARYVLLISRDAAGRKPVRQLTAQETAYLFRSKLADGTYFWFLRAVDASGHVGRASEARPFQLATDQTGGVTVERNPVPDPEKGP